MSLPGLLSGDSVTFQQRSANRQDAAAGIQAGGWQAVASLTGVPARVEDLSASAVQAYALRGMVVDSTIYTQAAGVAIGMRALTSDGRYKLVEGVKFNRAIGGMPNFYEVLCSEYRPGA